LKSGIVAGITSFDIMLKVVSSCLIKSKTFPEAPGLFRSFSVSKCLSAKVAPKPQGGKKKAKQGFKPKGEQKAGKAKKSGMTHLKFGDAVRALKFEKLAKNVDDLELKSLTHEQLQSSNEAIVKFETSVEKNLLTLGSFKKYQHYELFSRPVSMVTENTLQVDEMLISKLHSPSSANRLCLLGEKGSGKSTLMSQVKALAYSKYNGDVVLLHLDYPERIVEGSSDYVYNRKIEKYQQPMFTKRWIMKIRSANENVLKKMPLTRDISVVSKKKTYDLKKGENNLYDYLLLNHDFGKVGANNAFGFFIEELKYHSKSIPVLVSVDNFNALTSKTDTKYRHPNFEPIHFTDFEMGDFFMRVAA
ncbi:uncharacterized protein PRCAT00000168001, partial [Priceomyces carsonii]|uniref:uncharacterized protein n=1 Tax=Priceomyces carsonii TaxID=28549 RepID=UPI002EDAC1CE